MTTGAGAFDWQPHLVGDAVEIRPLTAADRPGLTAAAGDPAIWAGHPARDRWRPEVFGPYFDFLLATGQALALIDRGTGAIVGCTRFYPVPDDPDSVGIGYTFLDRAHWGGGTNFAIKALMLAHAFAVFSRVWFHIGPDNHRSRTATGRLGAVYDHDDILTAGPAPSAVVCYRLDRAAWARVLADRGGERQEL